MCSRRPLCRNLVSNECGPSRATLTGCLPFSGTESVEEGLDKYPSAFCFAYEWVFETTTPPPPATPPRSQHKASTASATTPVARRHWHHRPATTPHRRRRPLPAASGACCRRGTSACVAATARGASHFRAAARAPTHATASTSSRPAPAGPDARGRLRTRTSLTRGAWTGDGESCA